MNYFLLVYPVLSVASFSLIFYFPPGMPFFYFISFIFLLWYGEKPERDKLTDAASLLLIALGTLAYTKGGNAYYMPISMLFFTVIPAVVLVFMRKRGVPAYLPVMLAPVPATAVLAILIAFVPEVRSFLTAEMLEYMNSLAESMKNASERLGESGTASYLFADKQRSAKAFMALMPGFLYVFISVCTYIADKSKPVSDVAGNPVIRDYRLPDILVWFFIVSGFIAFIGNVYFKYAGYNLLMVFAVLYFFQGAQMLSVWFDKLRLSRFIRMLAYVFVALEPFLILLIAVFGLFSIWFRPKWTVREGAPAGGGKNGGS